MILALGINIAMVLMLCFWIMLVMVFVEPSRRKDTVLTLSFAGLGIISGAALLGLIIYMTTIVHGT